MQDAIIREIGNSRYLRTIAGIKQICPDYDSFLALLVKGEFPIDFAGVNADGWAQLGTALNKANLLTDATAALADLGPGATPNEMFAALANAAKSANSTAGAARDAASAAQAVAQDANSKITYGTSGLTAGVSSLATGTIYVKYE